MKASDQLTCPTSLDFLLLTLEALHPHISPCNILQEVVHVCSHAISMVLKTPLFHASHIRTIFILRYIFIYTILTLH